MTLYQPGIPTGTVDLDQDYQNLQNNFQQLDTTFAVDHVAFSVSENNGSHRAVHMVPVSTTLSNPPRNQPINGYVATPGLGQIFDAQINDGIDTDEALFFLSGGNKLDQLTRNFVPVAATTGATYLPGGIIVAWGARLPGVGITFTSGETGTVAFGNALFPTTSASIFPTSCFRVFTTLTFSTASTVAGSIAISNLTSAGFNWNYGGPSARYNLFQWLAIGI